MNGEDLKIGKQGYISIGLGILVLASALWIRDGQTASRELGQKALDQLENYKVIQKLSNELLLARIDAISKSTDAAATERYTNHDHLIFVDRLRELNPNMRIPK